jgi:hypothetical protein
VEELTGHERPTQRTANELIAAERELSHLQTRVLQARRDADAALALSAEARQDRAARQITALRARLYEERRRELLDDADARAPRRSLFGQLLGR